MKRKMKRLAVLGTVFLTFLFSGILVACSNLGLGNLGFGKTKLNGFEVKDRVTVDYGSLVTVETPIVTDDEGNFYEVMSDVADSKGGYVVVEANSFRAWDVNGYTIDYIVRVSGNQVEQRTTKVNVINTQALTVSADYNEFEDTDTNIVIAPECDEEVEYTYTVTNMKTEEIIPVNTDGAEVYFVCEEAGNYAVEIVAKQEERYGSYGYTVIVREAVGRTNVEHIDEQWEEVARYLGDARVGRYEVVSSEECGLKDHYGDDAYFLKFTSTAEWLTYHISPRYSKEHYEALVAEGYDQVTVYCYVVSEQNKSHTYAIRTMTSGFYERSPVTSYPNQWNEINMNFDLVPGKEVNRSFLAAYDYYKTQDGWFLCYNNEGELATRDVLTLYFSDMYVTKPVEITTVEGATTEYAVGDYISKSTMNEFFASESSLRYFVNFRGERMEITGDYEFKANGEYVIEALPESKDERGLATVTLNVTDEYQATYSYYAQERIDDGAWVDLTKLNAGFSTVNGVTPIVKGYRAYDRYGVEYSVEKDTNAFVTMYDGMYTIEVEGTYEIAGTTYKTYCTANLDVWSQANKMKVVAVEDMYSANAWEYQSTNKQTMEVGEFTIGGVTKNMYRFTKSGDNITLTVKPFYSKQYYENLLSASTTDLVFGMNVYFESGNQTTTPTMSTCRSFFDNFGKCVYEKDTWTMQIIDFAKFIEKYDDFVAGYELQKYNVNNKIKYGYDVNGAWKNYIFYAEMNGRAQYAYVQDLMAYSIETVEDIQIVERTSTKIALTSLNDAFTGMNFTPMAIVKATKNGTDVTVSGDSFITGESDGVYTVLVQGAKNGANHVISLTVDVWSQATKNTVIALEDMFAIGGYSYQSFRKEATTVSEYTVDGKTQTMMQLTAGGIECSVVVGKPLHSKKYYEQLLANDTYYTSYVTMDWYFYALEDKTEDITPFYGMFGNYERQGAQTKNEWLSGKITLAEFVAQYDDFLSLYERTEEEYKLGQSFKYGRFVDTKGVCDPNGNVVGGYIMATKFRNETNSKKLDYAYFTSLSVMTEMKNEQAKTLLVDRSQTTSLNLETLTENSDSVAYWKSEGYDISCEVIARYGAKKVNNGSTVTISNTIEDGIYYLTVTATKGNHTGVCFSQEIDVYDGTQEIVEYENFKHSDSKYAIRIYWAKFSKQAFSYENTTFNIQSPEAWGATLDNVDFGEGTDENTLYILSQSTTTLTSGSNSQTAVNDTNYSGREIGYIAYSWASQDTYDKLQYAHSNGAYYQYIYTYVLPRHSLAYYEAFADKASGTFEMLYKSTDSNKDKLGRMRYMYPTSIADGKISMAYTGNVWSSNNQPTNGKITMDINTIIDNYDSFANCKVPMLVMMHMAGTTTASAESRLYEMGFHKNS